VRLILASTSPRRREIVNLLGVPFDVAAPRYEEIHDPRVPPERQAMHFALEKARSVQSADAVVIGSDTVVVLDDVVSSVTLDRCLASSVTLDRCLALGKPVDLDDARRMLTMLRGRTHRVVTAVAVLAPGRADQVWCETASVAMRAADDGEIDAYLRTGESMDKAGAYALQGEGGRLIETIDGDRFVVIGLPLRSVADALRRCGIPVAVDVDAVYARQQSSVTLDARQRSSVTLDATP
jgi:septum formation protein